MSRITGNGNVFYTYKMSLKKHTVTSKEDKLKSILNTLNNNKVSNLSDVGSGFIPYQFKSDTNLDSDFDTENEELKGILVAQHYKKELKKGERFLDLSNYVNSQLQPSRKKSELEKLFDKYNYNQFYQDYIFIPGRQQKLIFPSNPGNKDNVINYELNEYFGDVFEFNVDPITRNITPDVLDWLLWKAKRIDNGFVGLDLIITEIDEYDSSARLNSGKLKVSSNGVEDNPHSMLSMACEGQCYGLGLSLTYDGDRFSFDLLVEGGYVPKWRKIPRYNDNIEINRILIIEKISQEIIPYIYKQYFRNRKEWEILKPQIKDTLRKEVSSLL